MKNYSVIMIFLVVSAMPFKAIYAQESNAKSTVYIHKEEASFKSKLVQKVASIFGVKKHIEKSMLHSKYDHEVAPIPRSITSQFISIEMTKKGRRIWVLRPKKQQSKKIVLYLHGGAYHWNISKYNWAFVESLLTTTDATIIVPDFPLAPHAKCTEVYTYLEELYQDLMETHCAADISIMGESSGGGLALGFTMYLRNKQQSLPEQLILLAPWLDATMKNPDIAAVDANDKILGVKGLQMAGERYAGTLALDDYRVSPIYGDLTGLPKISLFVGTHDLFLADSRKLQKKLQELDMNIHYYEYPKMFHVWIFMTKLKEARVALKQIDTLLKA